jgi:hypothetical protein
MARLSAEKLQLLKKALTEEAMSPGQAAEHVGVTYATANRYYDLWGDEIKQALESRLLPNLNESVKQQHGKKPAKSKAGKTKKDIGEASDARCEEKSRLTSEYRAATDLYSTAVAELSRRIGIGSVDDYWKLHEAAETARTRSNEAGDRLARHIAEHHCEDRHG